MPLLEVAQLGISHGKRNLLDGLSLIVEPGERIGIIGDSGSGKTVLASALAACLPPTLVRTGSIDIDGGPLPSNDAELTRLLGRLIGYLPQDAAATLDPLLTMRAQLTEAISYDRRLGSGRPTAESLLALVGLDLRHASSTQARLTPGEQRLAALALVLATEPQMLVVDEPLVGLDPLRQRKMVDAIRSQCDANGMALIVLSRDLRTIGALATRLLVLESGRIVDQGAMPGLLATPGHDATRRIAEAIKPRRRTMAEVPVSVAPPLLEVRDVTSRAAGQPALTGVSFDVRAAETVALVGPEGGGKLLISRLVLGLAAPGSGAITFDKQAVGLRMPMPLRRELALVTPDPHLSLDPALTLGESIAEPLHLLPALVASARRERIEVAASSTGLEPHHLLLRPGQVSPDIAQRAAIARAIVTRPRLVVLDEPVAGLDLVPRADLTVLLSRLRADLGLAYLLVSNDLDLINMLADRVLVVADGKVVDQGKPASLLGNPQHEITRSLLAARLPPIVVKAASPA